MTRRPGLMSEHCLIHFISDLRGEAVITNMMLALFSRKQCAPDVVKGGRRGSVPPEARATCTRLTRKDKPSFMEQMSCQVHRVNMNNGDYS